MQPEKIGEERLQNPVDAAAMFPIIVLNEYIYIT